MGRPCPRCGGEDRFYLVSRPRSGGAPFWLCNLCRHVERTSDDDSEFRGRQPIYQPTAEEREQIYRGYKAVAEWCAVYLFTPDGRPALDYLVGRGLSVETIHQAGLGYHPDTRDGGAGPVLFHRDRDAYEGARLGGLFGPQGLPKSSLRGAITFPYRSPDGQQVTMLRMRKLPPIDPITKRFQPEPPGAKKYFAPAGVPLYAGGTPTLYGVEALADVPADEPVLLEEGEIKPLLCRQHGMPAVGQPGVAYLPDAFAEQLAGRTVVVTYDVEARKDPFQLSPGERASLSAAERLTRIGTTQALKQQFEAAEAIKLAAKSADDTQRQQELTVALGAINSRIKDLQVREAQIKRRNLRVRILRLPRDPDEAKVDPDGFILRHGAARLKQLRDAAPLAEDWHARHSGGGFEYQKGGIVNGKPIANYQARIMEVVYQHDGVAVSTVMRVALRAPGGRLLTDDIPAADWADDRAARLRIREALRDGTYDDDAREVVRAIRLLSAHGDPPVERVVYTATGWEPINGAWHFLAPDGAITARGITPGARAELDPDITGNHYALCGPGDPALGAAAWLKFLRGEVCPQPLALILAAQAALPLIHRFSGTSARTMVWLFHQSGALKTALTRASVLALYGPGFTAERADGGPVPKWDATNVGLGLLVFFYRDLPLLIDDYKQGVIHPDQFKRFLHNYSESTGRTRGTKYQGIDRIKPARCIVFATAEDLPSIGDSGMDARLLAMQLHPSATNPEALAELQRAGAAGHLAAFWRGFIQQLAGELDQFGEFGVRERIRQLFQADDEALPGHKRMGGALRQNRVAWLVLSSWLQQAGWLSTEEAAALNAAHLETRTLLARTLTERQHQNKPGSIFLTVLRELVASGSYLIERPGMTCPRPNCEAPLVFRDQGWFCTGVHGDHAIPCTYTIPADRILGFELEDGSVGLFSEKAFQAVSKVRNDQGQRFAFTSTAVWQQLDADGALASRGKDGRPQVTRRNPARTLKEPYGDPFKVLHLKVGILAPGDSDTSAEEEEDQGVEIMGSMGSMGSKSVFAQQDAKTDSPTHGIAMGSNGAGVGSEAPAGEGSIPSIPSRSHAWDRELAASGSAEPGFDPIDPMISTHTSPANGEVSAPMPGDLPAGFTPSLWRAAIRAFKAHDTAIVNRIAQGRSMAYDDLVERITRALG